MTDATVHPCARATLLVVLAVLTVAGIQAMPIREEPPMTLAEMEGRRIVVRGVLQRYDALPHSFLGVLVERSNQVRPADQQAGEVTIDGEVVIRLEANSESGLDALQSRFVEVTGVLTEVPASALRNPTIRVITVREVTEP